MASLATHTKSLIEHGRILLKGTRKQGHKGSMTQIEDAPTRISLPLYLSNNLLCPNPQRRTPGSAVYAVSKYNSHYRGLARTGVDIRGLSVQKTKLYPAKYSSYSPHSAEHAFRSTPVQSPTRNSVPSAQYHTLASCQVRWSTRGSNAVTRERSHGPNTPCHWPQGSETPRHRW